MCNLIIAPPKRLRQGEKSLADLHLFTVRLLETIMRIAHVFKKGKPAKGSRTATRCLAFAAIRGRWKEADMQLLVRPPDSNRTESYGFDFIGFRTQRLTPRDRVRGGHRRPRAGHRTARRPDAPWNRRAAHGPISAGAPTYSAGMPYALYLPIHTQFTVTTETECDMAFCYCRAGKALSRPTGDARRRGRGDPRRRQRHPPDQWHLQAGFSGGQTDRGGGLHAQRQLVELPAA